MPDFLLELFSEEIPARMQTDAAEHLQSALVAAIREKIGDYAAAPQRFVTPRRVAVLLRDLPERTPNIEVERKGPKTSASQSAIEGFLRSTGLALEQLEKRLAGKDETYFAIIRQPGRPMAEALREITEEALLQFPWPKSMRWGAYDMRWVRPLHSILCLFGHEVVPVRFGHITATGQTHGHRFLHPDPVVINTPDEYREKLRNAFVIADFHERKERIRSEAEALAGLHGLHLADDPGLLDEVTGLVEWPVPLIGTIDARFMGLPSEVLVTVMRSHQKYFALRDTTAKLAPRFIAVANRTTMDDGKSIIAGNERVLRARFSDAEFFWNQDKAKTLDAWAEGLKTVTYHAKLGSIADKAERIAALAGALAEYIPGADKAKVARAAALAKADLVTGMVGEFAELQGIMGAYYAEAQGEDRQVTQAIREQYRHAKGEIPTAPVSLSIALADRLDTLISMFAIGEKPTGSKDPFALRRSGISIVRMIVENKLHAPLKRLGVSEEIVQFLIDRLYIYLREEGIGSDQVKAVLNEDDLYSIGLRARVLHAFLATEDGKNLLAGFKRAANILKIEEEKDKIRYTGLGIPANDANEEIEDSVECALYQQSMTAADTINNSLVSDNYFLAVQSLAKLRAPADAFFEHKLVNDPDPATRTRRLKILATMRDAMLLAADFSLIEG